MTPVKVARDDTDQGRLWRCVAVAPQWGGRHCSGGKPPGVPRSTAANSRHGVLLCHVPSATGHWDKREAVGSGSPRRLPSLYR